MTTLAVITGASRGIGAAVAASAHGDGAVVAACNRAHAGLDHELNVDLADPAAWRDLAVWYDGLVDGVAPDRAVFVHNAATLDPMGFAGDVDAASYAAHVQLNSSAPQVIGDAVVRTARRTGVPTVLLQLSSGASTNPYPGWSGYCAAKAAVDMWVRVVGREQEQVGGPVRVCAVAPGVVATDMQAFIRGSTEEQFPTVERFRDMHAAGQLADADDVGRRLWALAGDDSWDNGAVIDLRSRS